MITSVRATRAVGLRSTMAELFEASRASPRSTGRRARSAPTTPCCVAISTRDSATPESVISPCGGPLAASTVARIHVVLRSCLAHAMRWGGSGTTPGAHSQDRRAGTGGLCTDAGRGRLTDRTSRPARSDVVRLLTTLAATTGARRAQLLGLCWSDVRFSSRCIRFCRGWVEGPNGPVLAATKTRRRHSVDLDRRTCELPAEYAQRAAARAGGVLDPKAFVFATDLVGRSAWKPNRRPKPSSEPAVLSASRESSSATSDTSWRPRCSTPARPSSSLRADWTTPESPPPSTTTLIPFPAATQPSCSPGAFATPNRNPTDPWRPRYRRPDDGARRVIVRRSYSIVVDDVA